MVGDCKCCVCWVKQAESTPIVSDNQFIVGGKFNRIEVGFVPVNAFTFFDRYQILVEQLSLSKPAFDFWSTIKSQKEGASSLFQPSFGEVKTNIHPINGGPSVLGIFYAAGKAKKSLFITKDQVPVPVPAPSAVISEQCDIVFPLSSTNKPSGWN
jgi:hypothetical protein